MAYRGQGQKVQKVMVQPIVSYAGCQDWEVRARIRGAKAQTESRPGVAEYESTSHEPPGRPRLEESAATVVQNLIFRYLQNRSRIQVWLYEQVNMRIEGCIIGFDEYMNLVLDDAEEIHSKTKSRKQLGRIMLKGDNITLLQSVSN
ncbi:small nuclear ribonucleoprotein E isoform X6 [Macaca fascicularis]|uniref:Small nuclear ribonucleoprotein E n=2 Tax=Macaca TaxID=9539 RepID=A0A5F7ZPN9_MACMU